MLKALKCLTGDWSNLRFFSNRIKLHETLISLLHINCPNELNCQFHIIIPDSETVQDIQGFLFDIFADLSRNSTVKLFIQENHNGFKHIIPIIRTSSTLLIRQSYSKRILSGSLHLLWAFLYNEQNLCQLYSQTPNLTQSLFSMINWGNIRTYSIMDRCNIAIDQTIRKWSNSCIYCLLYFSSEMILKYRIIKILMQAEQKEESSEVIRDILRSVGLIFKLLHKGIIQTNQDQIQNDFQEEGGLEEIDYLTFHTKDDDVRQWAYEIFYDLYSPI